MSATYGFDFADRETTLSVTTPAGTTDLVTAVTYLPSGPLDTLTFGTGAWEDRKFDSRYFPDSIVLTANRGRTWTYSTDAVGNPTQIVEELSCPGDLTLANAVVTTAELYESCDGIVAGPAYTVAAGGELTLTATSTVVFENGFSVEAGGTLVAGTDPALSGDVTEAYAYQDVDYFLTSATGTWGSQSWTYDRIGNRLSETDNGATDTYTYLANGAGGNTARLDSIALSTLGTRDYAYTPAGHVDEVSAGGNLVDFSWDDAGRLAASDRASDTAAFLYDGRGFLRQAGDAAGPGTVAPTYDSAGLLHCLQRTVPTGTVDYQIFYLAGRPVGQVALESGQADRWWYFTTDHLGTPVVATDGAQDELWVNRFDPFGKDPFAWTNQGASEQEVFLRFPGQWDDPVWRAAMMGAEGYQNVYRWLEPGTGRYTRPDPMTEEIDPNRYYYGRSNPLVYTDPLGLLCQLTPQFRSCLSRIFGFPVQQIKVIDNSKLPDLLTGGRTFTLPGQIHLPGSCQDFYQYPGLVLHEYYHVVDQWGTGRMTLGGYLAEGAGQWLKGRDPHGDNRFEEEATFFANTHKGNLKDCLGCAPLPQSPPPFDPCPPGAGAMTRALGTTCN